MGFLEPRLSLKVQQKQILTPGLVEMVSLLTLNKLELIDQIHSFGSEVAPLLND